MTKMTTDDYGGPGITRMTRDDWMTGVTRMTGITAMSEITWMTKND